MTNRQVREAFFARRRANSKSLVSDGDRLLSYGWWEVARWHNGEIIVRVGPSFSMTTATKHRSGVYGKHANTETPRTQAVMNL